MIKKYLQVCLVSMLLISQVACAQQTPRRKRTPASAQHPQNVILMIPDGFGPASLTMARDYRQQVTGDKSKGLALDEYLVGTARTYSTDSWVTDSAAGATAYACGIKSYNGAIAVDPQGKPCATLFEAAKEKGITTGVVVTTRITHATPAAFSSHVPRRANEDDIAAQQIEQGMKVIFGGGGMYFTPKETGGKRTDGRNLLTESKAKGYTVVQDLASFRAATKAPLMAVFAPDHMNFEIDRDPNVQPSLAEMTKKALELVKNSPKGFLIMVEGSRIDHAAHANDLGGHVHDILAYDDAVRVALDFAKADGNTLVISVADHETGGLTVGRDGVYNWKPENLMKVKASLDVLIPALQAVNADMKAILKDKAGIDDLTDAELALLQKDLTNNSQFSFTVAGIISKRSGIAWTTGGHTAVDVNVVAYGRGSELLRGNHENTNVGNVIAQVMGFDLKALTKKMFGE
jgi:alkaline phosphatase